MSLLTDLDAFSLEHRYCGDLDGGVDEDIVWMACDCGAGMARRVDRMMMPAPVELDAARPVTPLLT